MRLPPRALALVISPLLAASAVAGQGAPAARSGALKPVARVERGGAASPITAAEIDGDLRFLSSDLLEGRGPGTRGGRLAEEYIASQLRSAGIQPGNKGSYFQDVPTDVVTLEPSSLHAQASGKATASLRDPEDVVLWAGSALAESGAKGDLVFVGYGVRAPEYRWDDFKGLDLKGKILLVLVNDPPATAAEPELFGGKAMTYYGRWTYKFEEAERLGAAGMLIVHRTAEASYPWHTVVGSWSRDNRMLPRDPSLPAPRGFRGWITDSAATALLKQAGLDLAQLRQAADSRDFRPVDTGITLDVGFRSRVQHLKSENVIGLIPGDDPKLKDTYVVFSAHWDHLGIGPRVNGDSIYNGASDNASGVAAVLAVARAAQAGSRTRRSLLFAFVTCEECGLLGSEWLARHPPAPAESIVADLNMDGVDLLGRVRDLDVLGGNKSSLGLELGRLIAADGLRISPEAHPEAGSFYRSDHFSFAKAGIPAVSIGGGLDFVGRPAGWGKERSDEFTAHRYHQPSDEYDPGWDLSGAVQLSNIVLRFGRALASSATVPTWSKGAEFHRAGTPIS